MVCLVLNSVYILYVVMYWSTSIGSYDSRDVHIVLEGVCNKRKCGRRSLIIHSFYWRTTELNDYMKQWPAFQHKSQPIAELVLYRSTLSAVLTLNRLLLFGPSPSFTVSCATDESKGNIHTPLSTGLVPWDSLAPKRFTLLICFNENKALLWMLPNGRKQYDKKPLLDRIWIIATPWYGDFVKVNPRLERPDFWEKVWRRVAVTHPACVCSPNVTCYQKGTNTVLSGDNVY